MHHITFKVFMNDIFQMWNMFMESILKILSLQTVIFSSTKLLKNLSLNMVSFCCIELYLFWRYSVQWFSTYQNCICSEDSQCIHTQIYLFLTIFKDSEFKDGFFDFFILHLFWRFSAWIIFLSNTTVSKGQHLLPILCNFFW